MFGILKIKALLFGLLLASPPVAAWMLRGENPALRMSGVVPVSHTIPASPADGAVRIPVEIVAKGNAPQWVYVEVPNQTIPEPGAVSLLALTSLLVLRRQRSRGK